jgi:hypothetical protein
VVEVREWPIRSIMTLDLIADNEGGISVMLDHATWLERATPRLYWRRLGQADWTETRGRRTVSPTTTDLTDAVGQFDFADQACLKLEFRRRDGQTWEIHATLLSTTNEAIEIARCHILHGDLTVKTGLLAPAPHAPQSTRLFRPEEKITAAKPAMETWWRTMGVVWLCLADPIHIQSDWALSVDTGIFTEAWNEPGVYFGFTGPISAFGEIGMQTLSSPSSAFAGLLLDGVRLEAHQSRTLETLLIRAGDWQDSMKVWAAACAAATGVKALRPPLTGYCSWYQFYTKITVEQIKRAAAEFAQWPVPPGGRTIQIDDGYQITAGDWRPNARFEKEWSALPKQIEAAGSIPGLWLAPLAVQRRHSICTEHPDWLQRGGDGTPVVSFSNWGWCARDDLPAGDMSEPTYFLDPDHPEAREFIFKMISDAVASGWKYLKLDFTYPVSTARTACDPSKTRMESLRDLYRLFREAAGADTLICACIGEMGRYALGWADTARIGGDIGQSWDSISSNLPDTLVRMCTNNVWWNIDPDVFHMRQENLGMTAEEAWCLTATIGMIGGVFITSDFSSQWSREAQKRIRLFWNEEGPQPASDFYVAYLAEGRPQAMRFSYRAKDSIRHRVIIYNWSDQVRSVQVSLDSLGFSARVKLGAGPEQIGNLPPRLEGRSLIVQDLPPHELCFGSYIESS